MNKVIFILILIFFMTSEVNALSSTSETVAGKTNSTYENWKKLKGIVDLGYFLENYIVTGGVVTKDVTYNNIVNVTEIVVSLDDDVTRREAASFKTKVANTTYYLDYMSSGDFSWDTAHYNGTYLPIAQVTTDANKNVLVITDTRGEVGGFRLKDDYTVNPLYYQESVAYWARKAFVGDTILIECWGDSLYGSPRSSTEQSINPAPTVLQDTMRSYFSNNNITVTNYGVGGDSLHNRILTWETNMANSAANIVYADYLVNDALTQINVAGAALTYRAELIQLVKIARKHGKFLILETPNTIWAVKSLNAGMTVDVVEFTKQLCNEMRKVALEMNVPLVDNFKLTEKYMESGYESTALWDGLHPYDQLYRYKGLQMASALIYKEIPHAFTNTIIPLYSPGIISTGGVLATDVALPKSKVGRAIVGTTIKIPIFIEENDIDIYLALSKWTGGSISTIKFNGEVVRNDINLISADGFIPDIEVLIKKKAKYGFNLIEFTPNNPVARVSASYIRTRKNTDIMYNQLPSGITLSDANPVIDRLTITNDTGSKYIMTDIATSNALTKKYITVAAQFERSHGILLNWNRVDSKDDGYGMYIGLDFTTKYLTVYQVMDTGVTPTTIGSTDLSLASHVYIITMDIDGTYAVYVDGTLIGSVTNTSFFGGYLGFTVFGNVSQPIEYVKISG